MRNTNHLRDKWNKVMLLWNKVMLLLDELHKLYYSDKQDKTEWLGKFLRKMEELMEAYDEWLN